MREFQIDDVVRVTANAAKLRLVGADFALVGQTATIAEVRGCFFRLAGPELPEHGTWIQAKHIELVDQKRKNAGSESMVRDLRTNLTRS